MNWYVPPALQRNLKASCVTTTTRTTTTTTIDFLVPSKMGNSCRADQPLTFQKPVSFTKGSIQVAPRFVRV